VSARGLKKTYTPDFLSVCLTPANQPDESIFRILYYDCAMYSGTVKLPISGLDQTFRPTMLAPWRFPTGSIRCARGVLEFRRLQPLKTLIWNHGAYRRRFEPIFEPKVSICESASTAQRTLTITLSKESFYKWRYDCVPAVKYGRRAGLQTVLMTQPTGIAPDSWHIFDFNALRPFPRRAPNPANNACLTRRLHSPN